MLKWAMFGSLVVLACSSNDAKPGTGASSTGGAPNNTNGATGGAPAVGDGGTLPLPVACEIGIADELLITDVESVTQRVLSYAQAANPQNIAYDPTVRYWITNGDGTGTLQAQVATVSNTPIANNVSAMHVTGTGFSAWGASFGVVMAAQQNLDGQLELCYLDASSYSGISFWGRAASEVTDVRFKLSTATTASTDFDGICQAQCWDDYGVDLQLTTTWQKFEIKFVDMAQQGWGTPAAWTPELLGGVQWMIDSAVKPSFDIYIDQIEFIAGG